MSAPAVMTYSSLVNDIKEYCLRTNDDKFIAQIPRFVMLAENRVAVDAKIETVQMVVAGTLTADNPVLDKPAYWRDTISMNLTLASGKRVQLLPRFYEFMRVYWPDPNQVGVPKYYADYDYQHFFLAPTPGDALEYELTYHARLDPLSTSKETNFLTMYAPQLLFYAAMVEANIFLQNPDKTQLFAGMYNDSLQGLTKENSGRSSDRTTVPT